MLQPARQYGQGLREIAPRRGGKGGQILIEKLIAESRVLIVLTRPPDGRKPRPWNGTSSLRLFPSLNLKDLTTFGSEESLQTIGKRADVGLGRLGVL
jgi:hypothetical protein